MAEPRASAGNVIHFAGPPHRLLLLSAPELDLADVELEPGSDLAGAAHVDRTPVRIRRRRRGTGRSPLRIKIDRTTPPGDYEAVLRAGGERYPARITVEATPRLSAGPAEIRFAGAPGDEADARLTLINTGNVAIDVPRSASVGIYDDDGIEQAFAQTYRLETDDANQLVGHLLQKLRDGHGGLLKINVDGAGPLDGGATRVLSLRVQLAPKLKAGHSYHGVWSLDPLHVAVAVILRPEARGASK
jgi:hypothetical protein